MQSIFWTGYAVMNTVEWGNNKLLAFTLDRMTFMSNIHVKHLFFTRRVAQDLKPLPISKDFFPQKWLI